MSNDAYRIFSVMLDIMLNNKKEAKWLSFIKDSIKSVDVDMSLNTTSTNQLLALVLAFKNIKPKVSSFESNIKLLKKLLQYQYHFYYLCDAPDIDRHCMYRHLLDNYIDIYDKIRSDFSPVCNTNIRFDFNTEEPLCKSFERLDDFYSAAKIVIEMMYSHRIVSSIGVSSGYMPFYVYHAEIIGNEVKWTKRLSRYGECLSALYYKNKGLKKTEIIALLKYNIEDMPNSYKKLDKAIEEANELVRSAAQGTFPYTFC